MRAVTYDPSRATNYVDPLPADDVSFSIGLLTEASQISETDPAQLTDRHIRAVACYSQGDAVWYARRRWEAQHKAQSHAHTGRHASTNVGGLTAREEALMGGIAKTLREDIIKPLKDRLRRLDDSVVKLDIYHEHEVSLRTRVEPLDHTTRAAGGGLSWAGNYEPGRTYRGGELCRRGVDVWLCMLDTTKAPTAAVIDWQLFVQGAQPIR